jgi:hypothetical protein
MRLPVARPREEPGAGQVFTGDARRWFAMVRSTLIQQPSLADHRVGQGVGRVRVLRELRRGQDDDVRVEAPQPSRSRSLRSAMLTAAVDTPSPRASSLWLRYTPSSTGGGGSRFDLGPERVQGGLRRRPQAPLQRPLALTVAAGIVAGVPYDVPWAPWRDGERCVARSGSGGRERGPCPRCRMPGVGARARLRVGPVPGLHHEPRGGFESISSREQTPLSPGKRSGPPTQPRGPGVRLGTSYASRVRSAVLSVAPTRMGVGGRIGFGQQAKVEEHVGRRDARAPNRRSSGEAEGPSSLHRQHAKHPDREDQA